jgi:hypothetical protein
MPINEERARSTISNFCDEFPGLCQLKIIYAPTQEDFYGSKASVEALGYQIKGAFLPKRGELHLPLANFRDAGDLRKSLQHEALGHLGTLTLTGDDKRQLLEVISAARQSPSLQGDWAKVDKAYAGESELMNYCVMHSGSSYAYRLASPDRLFLKSLSSQTAMKGSL